MEVSAHLSSVFTGTVTSTYYNIVLQIFCKLLTFILNALVLRYISKELLGIVNVRLLLLHTTILFLCREGIRRAVSGNIHKEEWKQTVNLVWLAIVFSGIVAIVGAVIWIFAMENPDVPYYTIGVIAYGLSSCIEMLVEPMYILAQELMNLKLRIVAKFISTVVQSLINVSLVIFTPQHGILIFAISQVVGSSVYSAVFCRHFAKFLKYSAGDHPLPVNTMKDFLPGISPVPLLPERIKQLALSFTWQSFLKQILTEGERYIMSGFQLLTFAEQGIYDVISNLGSLVARLLFQQVEENAYVLFSKVLSREPVIQKNPSDTDAFGAKMLEVYLKTIVALSTMIVLFGYHYSHVLLFMYGGKDLSIGVALDLMRAFWFYVLFMAVNGVTEAFVFSAMNRQQVDRYNHILVCFSVAFLVISWNLVKWFGPIGFILANSINMALRIAHSVYFILHYYESTVFCPLKGIFVNRKYFAAWCTVWCIIASLRSVCDLSTISGTIMFLGSGAILGLALMYILWKTESELITFLWTLFRKKPIKAE